MEKMVWFHDPKNRIEYIDPVTYKKSFTFVYWSDAHMPASLVGLGAASLGVSNLPMAQLVARVVGTGVRDDRPGHGHHGGLRSPVAAHELL